MKHNFFNVLLIASLATLHLSAVTSTPVIDLVDFSVTSSEKKVTIEWVTQYEYSVGNYYLERAINDGEFKKLGSVQSNGNSSQLQKYSFRDQFAEGFSGKVHYRLMLQNTNGSRSRSIKQSVAIR